MATIDKPSPATKSKESFFDENGFPWLENGERLDQKTFHERYEKLPPGFKAELIGGIVYVMPSPLKLRHGIADARSSGWLYIYSAYTSGTRTQNNATTILGDDSEPQPDSALLILPEYGGQSVDGDDEYTHGAPEFIAEVAWSSRSIDLNDKLRDYERAGVLEYFVRDLKKKAIHWFVLDNGTFSPLPPDPDGLIRSRAFPGLWLDPAAMLAGDDATVIATLQRGLASPEHAAFVAELARRREARAAKP